MDQRSIVLYLARKGLSAKAISDDLVATLGPDAKSYATVTRFLREAKFPSPNPLATFSEETPGYDDSSEAILLALSEQPFASIRQLSRLTHLPPTTVYRRLTQSLGFHVRHLRWIPHRLSHSQKSDRVELSRQLLSMLEIQQVRSWHDIVTLDESWFYLCTDHEMIWLQSDEKVPERERPTIQSKKLMLTIVWNPNGFHLINVLSSGCKFNASHYVTNVLGPLTDWRAVQAGGSRRKLIIHADNARPHVATVTQQFLEHNAMKRAPHPAYSPDLAPSDFYLFGYVKQLLAGQEFPDGEALVGAINAILEGIEKVTLQRVFLEWMERLRRCIEIGGEYVD